MLIKRRIDKQIEGTRGMGRSFWPSAQCARFLVGSLFGVSAALGVVATADAGEVKFPKAQPKVILDVPDGWSRSETDQGLELQSPEKDSIVVLQIVPHTKAAMQTWTKIAGSKLEAFGVAFKSDKEAAKNPPAPAVSAATAPAPTLNTTGLATTPGAPSFTGAPTISTPANSAPGVLAGIGDTSINPAVKQRRLAFQSMGYAGTTRQGHPVDTDLAIFVLPSHEALLVMQESNPDDNRSVDIVKSVTLAK
jgi:hypothetical protein